MCKVFCHSEISYEAVFFFRPKRRTKMMTFLERTSCKYSGVIRADCRLTYRPTVRTSCVQWQDPSDSLFQSIRMRPQNGRRALRYNFIGLQDRIFLSVKLPLYHVCDEFFPTCKNVIAILPLLCGQHSEMYSSCIKCILSCLHHIFSMLFITLDAFRTRQIS